MVGATESSWGLHVEPTTRLDVPRYLRDLNAFARNKKGVPMNSNSYRYYSTPLARASPAEENLEVLRETLQRSLQSLVYPEEWVRNLGDGWSRSPSFAPQQMEPQEYSIIAVWR